MKIEFKSFKCKKDGHYLCILLLNNWGKRTGNLKVVNIPSMHIRKKSSIATNLVGQWKPKILKKCKKQQT